MRRLIIFCMLILLPLSAWAVATKDAVNATHEYQLSNGLRLIVREDHRAPVVLSSVWYRVGSSYEPNGITGISHALEHMMFRGTHAHAAGDLVRIVNASGGLQNAMTTNDYTMYYQFLPADKLAISFELEADRMNNLLLTANDYAKEIQVVMEERRMNWEDNPQSVTWIRLNAAAHLSNPDQHPTIGWKGDLKQMTVDDLRHWYHSWYGPNNAELIVIGDVNPANVYALAQHYFGNLPALKLPEVKKHFPEPMISTREVNVRLPAKLPWLVMAYNVPSLTTAKVNWQPYALLLLADLLGSGDSSRLASDLVRKQHIAVDMQADYDALRLYDSLFVITGTPTADHNNTDIKTSVLAEINNLQHQPVSETELQRVKAQVIAQYVYDKDSLQNQVMQMGAPEMVGLHWRVTEDIISHLQAVTPMQIQQVAQIYLQANRLTVANLIPIKSSSSSQQEPATGESSGPASSLH